MRDSPERVYALADEIRERCLRHLDSLLSPGAAVWTAEAANELVVRFVQAPDTGGGSFVKKLRSQLADASPRAVRLMAELTVLYEPPINVGVQVKRRNVEEIWDLAGESGPLPGRVLEAFAGGIATGYESQEVCDRCRRLISTSPSPARTSERKLAPTSFSLANWSSRSSRQQRVVSLLRGWDGTCEATSGCTGVPAGPTESVWRDLRRGAINTQGSPRSRATTGA